MALFSDRYIKSLKAGDKPYIVSEDSVERGSGRFQIKIHKSGRKQFLIQYFFNKRKTQLTIGNYGALSLAEARQEFNRLSAMVQQGINPKREIERVALEEAAALERERRLSGALRTFKELWMDYFSNLAPQTKIQSLNGLRWMFDKDIDPFISDGLLARDFTQDHARALLKRVIDRGANHKANNLHGRLKSCFKYGLSVDNAPQRFGESVLYGLSVNPLEGVPLPEPKGSQAVHRALSEEEVKTLWNLPRTKMRNRMHHLYFKLQLALAGQRVMEVYHSEHSEWDLKNRILEIPVERIKVQRRGTHVVPLSDLAVDIYKQIQLFSGAERFLFPHRDRDDRPASLAALSQYCKIYTDEYDDIAPFTPRDLRRTCKTLMTKCGVNRLYRDMLQQHDEIDSAAQKNYDKYDYLIEKRAAMEQWTAYLKLLVGEV